ncbi:hypothetical protein GGF46_001475 [Coemansia sp. RSA 552]|nr:hypothetical protein GGF46_001475 [Coemansia sp. RSA 552]
MRPYVIYDVYVSDNNDFAATSLRVKRVTVHPKYNPENHVNDIAVLEYDSQSSSSFHYDQGAYYMDYWVGHAFGQKYLVDVEKNQWSDLAFSTFDWTITETCDKYSEMYNTNVDYIICDDRTPATDLSPNNLGCPLPVGATFGIFEDKTVVTGLYSYTVLDGGNDICSAKSYRVYYTALYPYIGFFEVVVGGKIPTVGDITTPVMVDRDFEEDKNSGRKFVGKGFTRELGAETKPESSSEDSSIDTEDSEFSTDDSLNDSGDSESSTEGFSNDSGNSESSTNDDDGSEGLSRQAVIAIAVCVPVIGDFKDSVDNGVIDKDVIYDVYVSDNDDFAATSFRMTQITVHPRYNPENHVNDIAVLEFDGLFPFPHYYDQGAYYLNTWEKSAFGQKYLVDVEENQWSNLAFSTFDWTVSNTCSVYSEMYKVNQDCIICNDNTLTTDLSPSSLDCSLPVGATFGSFNGTAAVTGLYSYAVLDGGDNICSAKTYRVYYSALYLHLDFFGMVLGYKLRTVGDVTSYTMVDRVFEEDKNSGRKFVGKGFTRELGAEAEPESSSEDSFIDAGDAESSTDSDDSAGSLSRQAVIAIAVCIPVIVLLLLGIGLWFFCKRMIRHRHDNMVSPVVSDNYQNILVVEQQQAEAPILESVEARSPNNPTAALLPQDSTVAGLGTHQLIASSRLQAMTWTTCRRSMMMPWKVITHLP